MAELHWAGSVQPEHSRVQQAGEFGEYLEPIVDVALINPLWQQSRVFTIWWGEKVLRPWEHPEGKYDPPKWQLKWWPES